MTQVNRPKIAPDKMSGYRYVDKSVFRHRRQLRNWASYVLVLWLFGVWAGVANACLGSSAMQADAAVAARHALQAAGQSGHEQAGHQPTGHEHAGTTVHHHGDAAAPHPGAADDGENGPSLNSNCSGFCDKARVSLPSLKSSLDDSQLHALQPPAVAVIVTLPAVEPVQQWVPRRDGVRAPPIPIAFLRLTL